MVEAPDPPSLLVANRGEIAVRILRSAARLGLRTVAVHALDDVDALHVRLADRAVALPGDGPAAYLDGTGIVTAARQSGATLVHPGYGFLSENPAFARACLAAGLAFVGPDPGVLALVGDKLAARRAAQEHGIPVLAGSVGVVTPAEAEAFRRDHGSEGHPATVMLKAVAGGGGRGMRLVLGTDEMTAVHERCRSEAQAAFGSGELYVERALPEARHIEVQVVGDGTGAAVALGDRDCSIQRRHQKLLEIAPAPGLGEALRARLTAEAVTLTAALRYRGVGTVEFLVAADEHVFLEMNPRLQVEHTVTEEVFGVDLVAMQLELAQGATLAQIGLAGAGPGPARPARGSAVQARVCAETLASDGTVRASTGTIRSLHLPNGPGVRVDTAAYAGWTVSPRYDSLLAKVVVHAPETPDGAPSLPVALAALTRALREVRTDGIETNTALLRALLALPDFRPGQVGTSFVDDHRAALTTPATEVHDPVVPAPPSHPTGPTGAGVGPVVDPVHDGVAVPSPAQGTVVAVHVGVGDEVIAGDELAVLEAMKMEQVIVAPAGGTVRAVHATVGSPVAEGDAVLVLSPGGAGHASDEGTDDVDLDAVRDDLAALRARRVLLTDGARPDAVARRHAQGHRTARENVADLVDPGSFVEYGALTHAAQRARRSLEDLVANTPADGVIGGLARVGGAPCAVLSYDYMVLAGTQGTMGHRKTDRLLGVIERLSLPTVFFTEGGGGRPGDTDYPIGSALDVPTFATWGRLSGSAPRIGVVGGRCFAGNAAVFGSSDITIATADSSIGMGGPAMIEGGGLGVVAPDDVGPAQMQAANGVIDVVVADDAEAVAVARKALSFFGGPATGWTCADQRRLRWLVPENRLRVYDVRRVIETLADTDSVLELRARFAPGMVTALARLEGRPIGIVANNPTQLAGAVTSDNADKAARFLQLCDAFDLPVLFLCDTPGFMVGPEAERTGLVRHASRLFVTGASLSVPFGAVVLRKAYGLGAQAMAGGGFLETLFTVAWPTAEFGAMGLEGAVRLGMRKELAAIEDPAERQRVFEQVVGLAYERGKAVPTASFLEIDDVIDPADTRRVVATAFGAAPRPVSREGKKRPMVDTW